MVMPVDTLTGAKAAVSLVENPILKPPVNQPKPKAVDLPKKHKSKVKKHDKKTIGNPPKGVDKSDVLRMIQQLDGNASGIFANAIDMLTRIKAIDGLTSAGGIAGMASSALGQAMAMLSSSSSSSSSASSAMNDALGSTSDDSTLQDAIDEANRRIEVLTAVDEIITKLNERVNAIVVDPTTAVDQLTVIELLLDILNSYDLSICSQIQVLEIFQAFRALILTIDYSFLALPTAFPFSQIVIGVDVALDTLDFRGMDRPTLRLSGAPLTAAMRVSKMAVLDPALVETADHLDALLLEEDTYDDMEQCVNESINEIISDLTSALHSKNFTIEVLKTFLALLLELLRKKGQDKVFPEGEPSAGNAASFIPQVGSMIQNTVNQFLKRSINDTQKVRQSLDKFAKNHAKHEKKRKIVKEKLIPLPKPRPAEPDDVSSQTIPELPGGTTNPIFSPPLG